VSRADAVGVKPLLLAVIGLGTDLGDTEAREVARPLASVSTVVVARSVAAAGRQGQA